MPRSSRIAYRLGFNIGNRSSVRGIGPCRVRRILVALLLQLLDGLRNIRQLQITGSVYSSKLTSAECLTVVGGYSLSLQEGKT